MDRKMSDPGILTVITGNQGSGKTDTALRHAELILKKYPDRVIVTNIVMIKTDPRWRSWKGRIIFCNSMWDLIGILSDHLNVILILDEAGVFATSGSAGVRADVGQWEIFVKLMRKYGVSLFWIDQRGVGSIPPTMRVLSYYHIHKTDKFFLELWRGFRQEKGSKVKDKRKLTFNDRTGIPFDTDSSASWDMSFPRISDDEEITVRDLIDYLADVNGSSVRSTMKEWIEDIKRKHEDYVRSKERDSIEEEDVRKLSTLKDWVFWILDDWVRRCDENKEKGKDPDPEPKTSDLARISGRSPQSISRIKSEYRLKSD